MTVPAPPRRDGGINPVPPTAPTQQNAPMCPSFVGARVARITRLNSCGAPMYGRGNMATTIGMVTVTLEPEVEEGEALDTKNLNGELCVSASTPDSMTGINVSIEFCQVDPAVFTLLNPTWKTVRKSHNPADLNAPITGFRIGQSFSDECGFALELWPKAMGTVGQICNPDEDPDETDPWQVNGYFLLPYVVGKAPDEWEITGDEVATFTLQGRTRGGAAWGYGPYLVTRDEAENPSPLLNQIEDGSGRAMFPNLCYPIPSESSKPYRVNRDPDHFHAEIVTYAPPEAKCGAQDLYKPEIEFAAVPGADPQTVAIKLREGIADKVAPADPITGFRDPIYVSFGDGSDRVNITAPDQEGEWKVLHTYPNEAVGAHMIRATTKTGIYDELVAAPGSTVKVTAPDHQYEMLVNQQKRLKAWLQVPGRPDQDITFGSSWSSADTAVAAVTNVGAHKGLVRSKNAGKTNIFADYGGHRGYTEITVRKPKPTTLTLESRDGRDFVYERGSGLELYAKVTREGGSADYVTLAATWSTQNETAGAQATVTKDNTAVVLEAQSAGTADPASVDVVATYTEDGKTVTSEPMKFRVLKNPVKELRVHSPSGSNKVRQGGTLQLQANAVLTDETILDVTSNANTAWSSEDLPAGASVNGQGLVTATSSATLGKGHIKTVYTENGQNFEPPSLFEVEVISATRDDDEANPHTVSLTLDDAPDGALMADWGDGNTEEISGPGPHHHTYADDGTYEVVIRDAQGQEVTRDQFTAPKPEPRTTGKRAKR